MQPRPCIYMNRSRLRVKKPTAVIMDIEGTTTSARFCNEALVPYFRDNFELCLRDTWNQPETIDCVAMLRNKWAYECTQGNYGGPPIADDTAPRKEIIDSLTRYAFDLMGRRPCRELLSVQLLTWFYGYQNDFLHGHVYSDVQPALHRWRHQHHIRLFTFSGGIVIAQRLLFGCSLAGNLDMYFEDYFNNVWVGSKSDPESYRNIAKTIKEKETSIVHFSDDIVELKASQLAGMMPILVIRSHNRNRVVGCPFKYIKSFRDLEFV